MTTIGKTIAPVAAGTMVAGVPGGVVIATAKAANKTIGAPGSLAHVLTNDKLDKKGSVLAEQTKEGVKDTLKLGGIVAGTGAAAAAAVAKLPKANALFNGLKDKVSNLLGKFSYGNQSIKDLIKNTKIFQKFNTLPNPAKAAIAVGAAALALVGPLISLVSSAKAGYIEGQHEVK